MTPEAAANWAKQTAARAQATAAIKAGTAQGLTPEESVAAIGMNPATYGLTGDPNADANTFIMQGIATEVAKQQLAQTAAPAPAAPSWTPWAIGAAVVGGGFLLWRHFQK